MGSFATGIKSFQNMTEKKLDRTIRKTALDMYKSVIDLSPVDTGRFRQNNMISIDSEINTSKVFDKKESKQSLINEAKNTIPENVSGKTIVIQNNVSYAMDLEYGKSKQSPNGVYGITVLRFSNILKTNFNNEKLKG